MGARNATKQSSDPADTSGADRVEALLAALAQCECDDSRRLLEEELVSLTIDLADCAARRYRGRGVDQEDLTQVARLALVKAIRGYQSDKGHAFTAYAIPTVMGELKRYFRDAGWAVRPPRRLQEVRAAIAGAEDQLRQELMREPSPAELAEAVGVTAAVLAEARTATSGYRTTSLESGNTDGSPLQVPDPQDEVDNLVIRTALRSAVTGLTARERRILQLRFVEERTQSDIGAIIGVSQMQVSRLLTGILARLRTTLVDEAAAA
jgi:RNA polymerase sigma-B factor